MSGIESAGYFKARSDPARVSKRVVLQNWSLVKVFFNDLAVSPVPRRNTVLRKGRNIPSKHIFRNRLYFPEVSHAFDSRPSKLFLIGSLSLSMSVTETVLQICYACTFAIVF